MKNAGVKERKQQIHCSMAKHFAAPDRRAASPAWVDECHLWNINTALTLMYLNPLEFIKFAASKIPLMTSRLSIFTNQANSPSFSEKTVFFLFFFNQMTCRFLPPPDKWHVYLQAKASQSAPSIPAGEARPLPNNIQHLSSVGVLTWRTRCEAIYSSGHVHPHWSWRIWTLRLYWRGRFTLLPSCYVSPRATGYRCPHMHTWTWHICMAISSVASNHVA